MPQQHMHLLQDSLNQQPYITHYVLQDITNLRDFFEVNLEMTRSGSQITVFDVEETIVSRGHILPPAMIHNCDIQRSLVGEGSALRVSPPAFGAARPLSCLHLLKLSSWLQLFMSGMLFDGQYAIGFLANAWDLFCKHTYTHSILMTERLNCPYFHVLLFSMTTCCV